MLDKLIADLLKACAAGAGYEDAAAALRHAIAGVDGDKVTTKDGGVWKVTTSR